MPYTHRKIGNKECVFKKEDGSKVGCTSGPIKKYLAALHTNVDELVKLTEIKKPKIFTYTAYRLPNQEDIKEINNSNLSAKEIFNGFCYTLIGRGILNSKSKNQIIDAINMLIASKPSNDEYKKALEMAKDMKLKFVNESNLIKGGKADKLTIKDIANKFDVSVDDIEKQLEIGKKIEHEHTKDIDKAIEIAMDHLTEFPDYYTRLSNMEKEAKKIDIKENTKTLIKRLIRNKLN